MDAGRSHFILRQNTFTMIDSWYFNRDIAALRAKGSVSPEVADVLALHWSGELFTAWELAGKLLAQKHQQGNTAPPLLVAEHALLTVKLGHDLPEVAPSVLAGKLLPSIVYEYARYHAMYYVDQRAATGAMLRLFLFAFRAPMSGLFSLVLSSLGHGLVVGGWPRLGFAISRFFFIRATRSVARRGRTRFCENLILAIFIFTVARSGRFELVESVTHRVQPLLPRDPYYHTLFLAVSLCAAAYAGDHARTQVISAHFLKVQESAHLLRYYRPIAEIMPLLPLALRGYGHLVDEELETAVAHHKTLKPKVGHVINATFYRTASLIALSTGKFGNAKTFITKAMRHRKVTGSFGSWSKIDKKILEMAENHETFGPDDPNFIGVNISVSVSASVDKLLCDLVSALPVSLSGGLRAFEDRAFDLLRRHLDCPNAEIRTTPAMFSENVPQILIGKRFLVINGLSQKRAQAVDRVFASVAPALATLERNIHDMLTLKADNDRNARAMAIARTTQMLAHDVRRPFQLLRVGLESLAAARTQSEALDVVQTVLPEVRRACEDVDHLIADTMNMGDYPTPVPTPLDELVTESLRDVFAARTDCDIEIRHYGFDADVHLAVDPIRMRRAFSNVIANAVEAMQGVGFIRFVLAAGREEGFCELRIGNSGPPIPEDQMSLIFDAFHSSGKPGGTGLGLAIAQRVVFSHGGKISCHNRRDGVEFCLTLPSSRPQRRAGRKRVPAHSHEFTVATKAVALLPISRPARRGSALREIALIDDSRAIYLAWRAAVGDSATLRYYRSPGEFWAAIDEGPGLLGRLHAVVTDFHFSNRDECGSTLAIELRRRRRDLPIFVSSSAMLADVDVDGIFDRVIEKGGLSWPRIERAIASVRETFTSQSGVTLVVSGESEGDLRLIGIR